MTIGSYQQFCPVAMAAEITVHALDDRLAPRDVRRLDALQ